MSPLKTADSPDLCDVLMDAEQKNGNKGADSASLSDECKTNNALKQTEDDSQPKKEEDDNPDSDENDTDLEVACMFLVFVRTCTC